MFRNDFQSFRHRGPDTLYLLANFSAVNSMGWALSDPATLEQELLWLPVTSTSQVISSWPGWVKYVWSLACDPVQIPPILVIWRFLLSTSSTLVVLSTIRDWQKDPSHSDWSCHFGQPLCGRLIWSFILTMLIMLRKSNRLTQINSD